MIEFSQFARISQLRPGRSRCRFLKPKSSRVAWESRLVWCCYCSLAASAQATSDGHIYWNQSLDLPRRTGYQNFNVWEPAVASPDLPGLVVEVTVRATHLWSF